MSSRPDLVTLAEVKHHILTLLYCVLWWMVHSLNMKDIKRYLFTSKIKISDIIKITSENLSATELWCWSVPWTARRSNQSILKEIGPGISLEGMKLNQNSRTLATSCKELIHWKRLWCWEGLGAGGEGDDRRWDGWMASLTWWTWAWVNSSSWWWTGRPGVLRFLGLQRVGHDWVTEPKWTELN